MFLSRLLCKRQANGLRKPCVLQGTGGADRQELAYIIAQNLANRAANLGAIAPSGAPRKSGAHFSRQEPSRCYAKHTLERQTNKPVLASGCRKKTSSQLHSSGGHDYCRVSQYHLPWR